MRDTIYFLIFEGFADWQAALALCEIRRPGDWQVQCAGFSAAAVVSMGGLTVLPDVSLDQLDLARAALGLDPHLRIPAGVLIAASDHPVRGAELMATLRRRLHRPWAPPTPAILARLGAVVLRTDLALALTGRHTTSAVLRDLGHTYRFPRLKEALDDLLG